MSAAVFAIRGSISCCARPTRWLTPAGTPSRIATSCSARRAVAGQRHFRVVEHTVRVQQPADARERRVQQPGTRARSRSDRRPAPRSCRGRARAARAARAPSRRKLTSFRRSVPSSRRISRHRRSMCSIAATAGSRRSSATRAIASASDPHGTSALAVVGHRRQRAERHGRDHAERPLGPDEEIDQVHVRFRVIAGGPLDDVGHPVGRHRHVDRSARSRDGETAAMRAPLAAADGQLRPVRQDHRQRLDPRAHRSVPERRGAGRVGRHDPAGERAREGRRRRKPGAARRERVLDDGDRDARFHADVGRPDVEHARQLFRGEDHLAHGRRAAGQRRLGADGEDSLRACDDVGNFGGGAGNGDPGGMAARKVRRVREVFAVHRGQV